SGDLQQTLHGGNQARQGYPLIVYRARDKRPRSLQLQPIRYRDGQGSAGAYLSFVCAVPVFVLAAVLAGNLPLLARQAVAVAEFDEALVRKPIMIADASPYVDPSIFSGGCGRFHISSPRGVKFSGVNPRGAFPYLSLGSDNIIASELLPVPLI